MTNAAHLLSRLAFLVFGTLALMFALATITGSQASAAPSAPTIEPGIPNGRECVLRTTTTVYRVVADTDPRCTAWWGPNRNGPVPTVAPFDPNVKPAAKHAPKRVKHHAPKRAQKVRTIVVVPDLSTIETTPTICRMEQGPADGRFRWESCAPEESPNGGHVTTIYEDGSARYSDGYTIAPKKDVTSRTKGGAVLGKWKAPKHVANKYGAGAGAVCGTDGQCAAYAADHGLPVGGGYGDKA